MARLKSKTKFPPQEFCLLLPEIGMKTSLHGSFYEMVKAFGDIVRKNPAIAQRYNWPTDYASQEEFVEQREVKRLLANGWHEFVEFDAQADPPAASFTSVKKNWNGAAAVVVNRGKAAYAAYKEMYGPGGPVTRPVAEARAEICVGCPKNDVSSGVSSYFLESTAKGIMALLGALKDLDVRTSMDDKLGVCFACKCPLRAKIWTPIAVVAEHTTEEIWSQLPKDNPKCWILTQSNHA